MPGKPLFFKTSLSFCPYDLKFYRRLTINYYVALLLYISVFISGLDIYSLNNLHTPRGLFAREIRKLEFGWIVDFSELQTFWILRSKKSYKYKLKTNLRSCNTLFEWNWCRLILEKCGVLLQIEDLQTRGKNMSKTIHPL